MTKLSKEIITFSDAGAPDDHPVKGITMGHIRRWFDVVEEYEARLRIIAEASSAMAAVRRLPPMPGHEETMANLDALTIRSSSLSSKPLGGE